MRIFHDVCQTTGSALRIRTRALHAYALSASLLFLSYSSRSLSEPEDKLSESDRKAWARHFEELRHAVGSRNSKKAWGWMNKIF